MNFTNEEEILRTCYKVKKMVLNNCNSRAEIIRPPSIIKKLIKQKADRYRTKKIKSHLQYINVDPNELILLTKMTTDKISKALPKREITQEYSYTKFLNKTKKKSDKKYFLNSHHNFHFKRQINEASNINSINKEKKFIDKIIKDWDKKMIDVAKRTKETVNLNKEEMKLSNLSTFLNVGGEDDPSSLVYVDSVYRYVLNKSIKFERIGEGDGFMHLGRSMNSFSYSKVLSRFPHEKFNLLSKLLKVFIVHNEDENIDVVFNILKSYLEKLFKKGNVDLNRKEKRILILDESCSILEKEFFRKVQKCGKIQKIEEAPASLQYILGYINEKILTKGLKVIRDDQNFPIYAFILYSLRAGLKSDLIEFLEYTTLKEKENLLILLKNDQNDSYSFANAKNKLKCKPQEGYYKYQLSCLFNYNKNQEEDFSLSSTNDYLWYHLKQNLFLQENKEMQILEPLENLQEIIREGQKGDDGYSYKIIIRIYSFLLMFEDLVNQIGIINFNIGKAQNIFFFLMETNLIEDSIFVRRKDLMENYVKYVEEISKNEPVKCFAYFKCIKNNNLRQDLIVKFLVSHENILEKFFNTGTESKRNLLDFKNLLKSDYKNVISGIANKNIKETAQIWLLRILEELQLVNILLQNIISVNAQIIKNQIKEEKIENEKKNENINENLNNIEKRELNEKFNYLCKIFIDNKNSPNWANDANFNAAVKSHEIKSIFLSHKKDSRKRTLEMIDEGRIFEFNIKDEDDLIYILYLELCKLGLELLIEESLNVKRRRSLFSSDPTIRRIYARAENIKEFYKEFLEESNIDEEKGFDLPINTRVKINDLIFDLESSLK